MKIVAAENFYGDVASQIGGANVAVTSILSSPDQDPHLFEASAETARALADAKIVIVNGVDYDPWMEKLLGAHKAPGRKEIVVAQLVGRKAGDNPHLWYDPDYVKAAAKALAADLDAVDPAHKADYDKGEAQFLDSLKPLDAKIADMRKKYAGQPVIASEPVFGYQAGLIGLKVHEREIRARGDEQRRADGVRSRGVRKRSQGPQGRRRCSTTRRRASRRCSVWCRWPRTTAIPVVGVSETEPAGTTYQTWMLGQLDALDAALGGAAK